MRFIKRSARRDPRLTLILLDWSVRESFHLLHYLAAQDVPRDSFEVLVIEYYSRVSEAIRKFEGEVDTWLLLEMPEDCYYHKHLMYNAGIVLARGEICVICDSDAMVKPGFIRAILETFEREPQAALHLDQFRNNRRDLHPFSYPSFEEVAGEGCINNRGGTPSGMLDQEDPIHSRNYGACMCARRADLIGIGGADEHVDFLGHICGPYDLTFRLVNRGLRELWHPGEFMYHTWHPGQAGVDNYLGPHDGRHMSSTSLAALASGRVRPLVENPAIRRLREAPGTPAEELIDLIDRPQNREDWRRANIESGDLPKRYDAIDLHIANYKGFLVYREADRYYAHLPLDAHRGRGDDGRYTQYVEGGSLEAVQAGIDRITPWTIELSLLLARFLVYAWQLPRYLAGQALYALREPRAFMARAKQGVKEVTAQVGRRKAQFAAEGRTLAEAMSDLVPNLHFLSGRGPVSVVVESRLPEYYLRLLQGLGIVPPARLMRARNVAQAVPLFDAAVRAQDASLLLVGRRLYMRCYPLVAGRGFGRRLIVV